MSYCFLRAFLSDFRFVTRVAAAFVVPFVLFEGAAFGEIFFSATCITSLPDPGPFRG